MEEIQECNDLPTAAVPNEMKSNKVGSSNLVSATHAVSIMKKSSYNMHGKTRKKSWDSVGSSGHWVAKKPKKGDWMSRTFFKRECFKFVENAGKPGFCRCGLPRDRHKLQGTVIITDPSVTWVSEQCTRRIPTDTFGEIEFAEDPSSRKPYIRVAHDSESLSVLKLLTSRWDLKAPNLVISVTGGAKSFKLHTRLKEAFSKGLIKVAASTDAWIITGGTSTGVMKHVGEAVLSQTQIGNKAGKINCIGIAPWGQIDNSSHLISRNGRGCFPAHYTIEESDSSKAPLDINHSHFILVDNGTVGQYGVEIGLRSSVEGAIVQNLKTASQSSAGEIGIPVVMLCLEGGPNTIMTMAEAIKKGVPAVIVDDSGRAANVVAFAYNHTMEVDQVSVIDPQYVDAVKLKVADVFGKASQEKVYSQIEELLREKKMVSIYRLDNEKASLDLAILRALLKADKAGFTSKLKLSLAWNSIDIAKSEIFVERDKNNIKPEDFYGCMFTALIDNKPDFVSLFFNEGLQLKKYLTVDILCYLYAKLPRGAPVMQLILDTMNDRNRCISMHTIGLVIEELMGDKFKSMYRHSDYESSKISLDGSFEPDPNARKCLEPWLDLFIWAVLANRRELANIIWARSRENIAQALMASKLLKGLVEKVLTERDMVDIGSSLLEHASDWESTAIGVLDECRRQDDNLAQRLVVKELPMFSHLTSLDIAVSAEDQDFIAHPTCQALLNKLWLGTMSELTTHTWQVGIGLFLPFLIPFVISFSGDNDDSSYSNDEDHGRPSTVFQNNMDPDGDLLMIDEAAEEKSAIGSTRSFKDFDGKDNIELHGYVHEEGNAIVQLVGMDDPNDAVDATLRSARFSYIEKILRFYQAPFVKFFANVVSYLCFLGLYSFMILTNFKMKPHLSEYVLQAWVLTLIIEEFRQLITQEPNSLLRKVEWYFGSTWNIADFFSLCAFSTAVVLRYVAWYNNKQNYLDAAQIILATDVIIFIVRLLQIFSVNKNLGPKLVMIRRMLHDLKYFIFILAIFIIGYGVAFQAVRFPNTNIGKAIVGVINKPYWQMYGELFIEEILEDQKNCSTGQPICGQPGEEPCSSEYGKFIAPIYMAVYMLFTNILLLNLLIAIFNYTFEKVQEASDKVWKFQRYDLILEYHDRPVLSAPLIIISHFFLGIKWIVQRLRCCGCRPLQGSSMKFQVSPEENERLRMWEFTATETYIHTAKLVESETLDERVKFIQDRVESVAEEINDAVKNSGSGETSHAPDSPRARKMTQTRQANVMEGRIARLEYKMEQIHELLIQQSQKQAALLEAGKALANGPRVSSNTRRITTIHMKARTSPYTNSTVMRATVPDSCVPWESPFPEYMPVVYTAGVVLKQPPWADPDILSMDPRPLLPFNKFDRVVQTNRVSHTGEYPVIDKLPRNPMGRTGIVGRGLLGKWGPNHAVDPIVTRWKRNNSGVILDKGQRVLEFIAIQRKDNHQWAIPGGMVDNNERISETLKREFSEEALAKLDLAPERRRVMAERIEELFKQGTEVYKGYVDDPRNTDNAWMETVAYNFHDDTGEILGELELKAGDDAEAVRWQRVSGNIPLFASHVGILEKVASMHEAAFY